MKRGRIPLRDKIKPKVFEIISKYNFPLTISFIQREIIKEGRNVSWNTVKKYLEELVKEKKVKKIWLPHSKKERKKGLKVYTSTSN